MSFFKFYLWFIEKFSVKLSAALIKGTAREFYLQKTLAVFNVYNLFSSLAGFPLKFTAENLHQSRSSSVHPYPNFLSLT